MECPFQGSQHIDSYVWVSINFILYCVSRGFFFLTIDWSWDQTRGPQFSKQRHCLHHLLTVRVLSISAYWVCRQGSPEAFCRIVPAKVTLRVLGWTLKSRQCTEGRNLSPFLPPGWLLFRYSPAASLRKKDI